MIALALSISARESNSTNRQPVTAHARNPLLPNTQSIDQKQKNMTLRLSPLAVRRGLGLWQKCESRPNRLAGKPARVLCETMGDETCFNRTIASYSILRSNSPPRYADKSAEPPQTVEPIPLNSAGRKPEQ